MNFKTLFSSISLFSVLSPTVEGARACYGRRPASTSLRNYAGGIWDLAPRDVDNTFNQFAELFKVPISFNSLFEQQQRQIANMYNRVSSVTSPRYHVTEDDQKMDLTIELPGVREKDVSLDVQDGGKGLKLRAIRYFTHRGQEVHSEFEQLFTIDPELLDIDTISATLRDGLLVVSATKVPKKAERKGRRIPVTMTKIEEVTQIETLVGDSVEGEDVDKRHEVDVADTEDQEDGGDLEITEEDM